MAEPADDSEIEIVRRAYEVAAGDHARIQDGELAALLQQAGLAVHEVVEREPAAGATHGTLYLTARPSHRP